MSRRQKDLFFPDTYNYDRGSSDIMVLKRAYQLMQRNLQENWKKRDANLPFDTPYQALILASIVEKETGQPSDRPMIASVFINRLRKTHAFADRPDGHLRHGQTSSTATCANAICCVTPRTTPIPATV